MMTKAMTDEERTLAKRWVDTWKAAGPLLEKVREDDIRAADTMRDFEIFAGLVEMEVKKRPSLPTSGLVEQQRWFMKLAAV
ncbi:MAG: hypothetical protein B7Z37_29765 [Verrucomicrobia bacterium 12-59-8]|nr:MAG: hypothetical protein B7Z37_29765 [Verrucomicrobia bacterium 12-59-8]